MGHDQCLVCKRQHQSTSHEETISSLLWAHVPSAKHACKDNTIKHMSYVMVLNFKVFFQSFIVGQFGQAMKLKS